MTRDHIVPRALGGPDYVDNIVTACEPCNQQKYDKMPTCTCPVCLIAVAMYAPVEVDGKTIFYRKWSRGRKR